MNLFALLSRGAAHAPAKPRHTNAQIRAAEAARAMWLDALMVDETRAWLSLGEEQPEVLTAMATMLTLAGFVHAFDSRSVDTPDLRVIRGAISAATQCAEAGSVLTADNVRAFASACSRAEKIIRAGSVDAIIHAAVQIREAVGLPS